MNLKKRVYLSLNELDNQQSYSFVNYQTYQTRIFLVVKLNLRCCNHFFSKKFSFVFLHFSHLYPSISGKLILFKQLKIDTLSSFGIGKDKV